MPASVSTSPPTSPTFNPYYARWTNTPFPGETVEEAEARVRMLQEAVKKSKEIDESLNETKKLLEQRRKAVKILLLGQSESGKSSVLKNFQLAFAPRHFETARPTWKLIVQLNLIRQVLQLPVRCGELKHSLHSNIRTIIETLSVEWDSASPTAPADATQTVRNFRRIRLSLSPLLIIENNLMKMLAPETKDPTKDVCVRAGSGWKALLQAQRNGQSSQPSSPTEGAGHFGGPIASFVGRRQSHNSLNNESDPSQALIAQREEILWLWREPEIRKTLQRHSLQLEDSPGFFMNDVERIARANYMPTDSDIIRARLRTVGVEEHHFVVEKGGDSGSDVYITDVGGSRSQRASWVPYFDDVQAILFLAPLAFNLTLEEDPRVNRLEDSLNLWREICANRLLAGANLILFFNKKDLLVSTLASGIQVKRYVPSYGDLPNEITEVTKYFKDKFKSYHSPTCSSFTYISRQKRLSPTPRPFMCYETSAIDIKSMTVLLIGVRESILRQHLKNGEMI
ncbi:Guanine nucleotide-binding protein alpha-4 subunit [Leucoagaricus sp. SymC.cos]|nr:Guanine nucleotide-binding protein alpha-4 subunit [Leucoagaricus sp. SymC.cos]